MWNWFSCYLSGRHDYSAWCEPGTMFLRCVHCGRRSPGWAIEAKAMPPLTVARAQTVPNASASQMGRVVPFHRAATS
jgi:hypothetical protein